LEQIKLMVAKAIRARDDFIVLNADAMHGL